ncbi:hypothetical protein SBI_03188 [Streptomyces bingchenggensis BCW-1]|uniref:Uncharacterized protein n=1 Tax=Streptomyces bingchenggensis (strain BCW-1) TaxID=749414 RepID=D7C8C0_STRBB|nr:MULTISPECIES: hypothetical protein [Streptomyces]ADI06309.1 hypothetical protein SBI_03188 [Streptomyces bingchenggensis BCW-1]
MSSPEELRRQEHFLVAAAAARKGRWRRRGRRAWGLLRSRPGQLITVGVVSALIGSLLTAWQTDSLPWSDEKQAVCWGALSKKDAEALFDHDLFIRFDPDLSVRAEEIRPTHGSANVQGACRLLALDDGRPVARVDFRLHHLDGQYDAQSAGWLTDFLSPLAVPFGKGFVGMASESRTWLALPRGCGSGGGINGPAVVDASWGRPPMSSDEDPHWRNQVARATVRLANGAMRALRCDGTFPLPGDLPAVPPRKDTEPRRLCGIDGLTLTLPKKEYFLNSTLLTHSPGTARVCGVGDSSIRGRARLRLVTIESPRLAQVLSDLTDRNEAPDYEKRGRSSVGRDLALYQTMCQTGLVIFLVQDDGTGRDDLPRKLLPRYAAAEAERLGCGPVKVELPR